MGRKQEQLAAEPGGQQPEAGKVSLSCGAGTPPRQPRDEGGSLAGPAQEVNRVHPRESVSHHFSE